MKISICMLTYNRYDYAVETLKSTLENIKFSGDLYVHIGDDGTPEESYRKSLQELAGGYSFVKGTSVTNSERGGYGRNYNLAMQVVHSYADMVLPLEDDWRLTRELDLDFLSECLDETVGCIRLGYLGYTQPLLGMVIHRKNRAFLLLNPDTPEPHVFSGHPRLESKDWERRVGPWPEKLAAGETEFVIAHRREARCGVVWPIDYVKSWGDLYVHIGAVKA